MIDQQTVAKILDTARIEDVVGDFVTLKRRGVNYIGLCPFHDEKTGSFIVSPAKGIYKCFGCGKAGGVANFVMEHEQLSYPDALRYLARKYHIDIIEKELTDDERRQQSDRESLFALNTWAATYFTDKMHHTPDGQAIGMAYFRQRGFTDEIIRKFALGYCPDTPNQTTLDALRAGYQPQYIEQTGIGIHRDDDTWYDRFRGRVIFPVHTISGKIVAFGGRILRKTDKAAKYVNSPESEIYHKSNELYGIYFAKQAIIKADRCILVEGYTDVISMHQAGVTNVVASSGTSLTPGQIRLIHRFTPNVTILYDGDPAGIKASIRGIDLLLEQGMNIKVVLLPDGEDPDSFAQTHDAAEFIHFIEKNQVDFIRFKINLLLADAADDPILRANLISDVTRSVALIPDNIIRSVYIHETATALDVEERIIAAEVSKIIADKRSKQLARRAGGDYTPYHYSTEKHDTDPAYRHTPAPAPTPDDTPQPATPFDTHERNILRCLVRHGELPIPVDDQGNTLTVTRFIIDSLSDLDTPFHHPVHDRLYRIALTATYPAGTTARRYYLEYPDADISSLAASLIADRYQISRLYTKYDEYTGDPDDTRAIAEHRQKQAERQLDELLRELVTVIHEYKLAIVTRRERDIETEIAEAQKAGKIDQSIALLREKQHIKNLQRQLADYTGGRVITGPRTH